MNVVNTFGGEYVASVKREDGTIEYPFGQTPRKNLILDTFFMAICTGYRYNPDAYIQSCIVGTGNAPVDRLQTGLVGNIAMVTHRSNMFDRFVDTGNSVAYMQRNFVFNTGYQGAVREVGVGNYTAGTFSLSTSRFVLPEDIYLYSGDTFFITYKLNMGIPWLTRDYPIALSGTDGFVLTGFLRSRAHISTVFSTSDPSQTRLILNEATSTQRSNILFRNFTNQDTFTASSNALNALGGYSNLMPTRTMNDYSMAPAAGFLAPIGAGGFYSAAPDPLVWRVGDFSTWSTQGGNSNPVLGPNVAAIYRGIPYTGNSGVSVKITYYYPAHTSARLASGVYLNCDNVNDVFYNNYRLGIKFLPTGQLIPAFRPITLDMVWQFNRS